MGMEASPVERIVIKRRNLSIYVEAAIAASMIILAAFIALFVKLDPYFVVVLFIFLPIGIALLLMDVYYSARPNMKEIMIIDDDGLTINGNFFSGPVPWDCLPWDCIYGADVTSFFPEKKLIVYITNLYKIEKIFGPRAVRKKVGRTKTGERAIFISFSCCKLKGIDIKGLILERATGHKD